MKNKMKPKGGKMPMGMSSGGTKGDKLKMVKDPETGNQVPFFTVDGKGKMANGGKAKVPKTKGYFKGGRTMSKGGVAGGAKKKPPGMRYGGTAMKNKMNTKGGKMGGKG